MAQLGLTPADVADALREQNAQYAAGKIGAEPAPTGQSLVYTVTTRGRLVEPEEFEQHHGPRPTRPAATLRLKDVARVELGAQNYELHDTLDGKPTIGDRRLPAARRQRARGRRRGAKRRWTSSEAGFPQGVDYTIPFDTTRFVEASIKEVIKTLVEAIAARDPAWCSCSCRTGARR